MRKLLLTLALLFLATPCFAMKFVWMASDNGASATNNQMHTINGAGSYSSFANIAQVNMVLPISGTITGLYVHNLSSNPFNGTSITWAVYYNGGFGVVPQCVSTTAFPDCSDTARSQSFVPGDVVSIIDNTVSLTTPGSWAYTVVVDSGQTGVSALMSITSGNINNTTTQYMVPDGASAVNATVTNRQGIASEDGTLSNMYVQCASSAGTGTYTFSLNQNGSDTALAAVLAGTASGNDTTHSVSVTAGDLLSIEIAPTVTGGTASRCSVGMKFTANTDGHSMHMFGTNVAMVSASQDFAGPLGATTSWALSGSTAFAEAAAYNNFSITNLYAHVATAPSGVRSRQISFWKSSGSANTNPTCTISGTNKTCNDTTDIQTFSGNPDEVYLQMTPSGSPTSSGASSIGFSVYINPITSPSINKTTLNQRSTLRNAQIN